MKLLTVLFITILLAPTIWSQTPTPTQRSLWATTPNPGTGDGPLHNPSRYWMMKLRPIAEGAAWFKDTLDVDKMLTVLSEDVIGNVSAATFNGYRIPQDFSLVNHNHDDRYYTQGQLDTGVLNFLYASHAVLAVSFALKSDIGHTHDFYTTGQLNGGQLNNLYYTKVELNGGILNSLYATHIVLDGSFDAKSDIGHIHDDRYATHNILDASYYTKTVLNNGVLDTRYSTITILNASFNLKSATPHFHDVADIFGIVHYASPDFDIDIARISTTNLSEGSNLYYTDERVDDRVDVLVTDGEAILTTYNDGAGTLQFDVRYDDTTIKLNGNNDLYVPLQSISHADLLNITTDETHLQYLLLDGTRPMTGNFNLGTFDVISASGIEIKSDVGNVGGETTKIWDGDKKVLDFGYHNTDVTLSATGEFQIKHAAAAVLVVHATEFDINVETDLNAKSIIGVNEVTVNSIIFIATTVSDATTLKPALVDGEMVLWTPDGGPIVRAAIKYSGELRTQDLVTYDNRNPEHTYHYALVYANDMYLLRDHWWTE